MLKMEVIRSPEKSFHMRTTRRIIPEDRDSVSTVFQLLFRYLAGENEGENKRKGGNSLIRVSGNPTEITCPQVYITTLMSN
jgi:hypothetical protein